MATLADQIEAWTHRYWFGTGTEDVSWRDYPRPVDYIAAMLEEQAEVTHGSAATVLTIVIPR